jgi:hypothetical protein
LRRTRRRRKIFLSFSFLHLHVIVLSFPNSNSDELKICTYFETPNNEFAHEMWIDVTF